VNLGATWLSEVRNFNPDWGKDWEGGGENEQMNDCGMNK
jgi:hypothetical protein